MCRMLGAGKACEPIFEYMIKHQVYATHISEKEFRQRKPRIVFVSSISFVQDWALVYPTPVDVASPLCYRQSKHVSKRILVKAREVSGVPVTILRVGQVTGPTTVTGGKEPDIENLNIHKSSTVLYTGKYVLYAFLSRVLIMRQLDRTKQIKFQPNIK